MSREAKYTRVGGDGMVAIGLLVWAASVVTLGMLP